MASEALTGYSNWPHLGQVFRIDRWITQKGTTSHEAVMGVTSLSAARASAAELLGYVRGHWGIENRLHWVRDVSMGEDASQVRTENAPEVMAGLRNVVVGLFRSLGERNIAAAMRTFAAQPRRALEAIGILKKGE